MDDQLEELRGNMRSLRSSPDSDCDDLAFSDNLLWAVKKIERLQAALVPFAQPHSMGDRYVKFHPKLIEDARTALIDKDD